MWTHPNRNAQKHVSRSWTGLELTGETNHAPRPTPHWREGRKLAWKSQDGDARLTRLGVIPIFKIWERKRVYWENDRRPPWRGSNSGVFPKSSPVPVKFYFSCAYKIISRQSCTGLRVVTVHCSIVFRGERPSDAAISPFSRRCNTDPLLFTPTTQ